MQADLVGTVGNAECSTAETCPGSIRPVERVHGSSPVLGCRSWVGRERAVDAWAPAQHDGAARRSKPSWEGPVRSRSSTFGEIRNWHPVVRWGLRGYSYVELETTRARVVFRWIRNTGFRRQCVWLVLHSVTDGHLHFAQLMEDWPFWTTLDLSPFTLRANLFNPAVEANVAGFLQLPLVHAPEGGFQHVEATDRCITQVGAIWPIGLEMGWVLTLVPKCRPFHGQSHGRFPVSQKWRKNKRIGQVVPNVPYVPKSRPRKPSTGGLRQSRSEGQVQGPSSAHVVRSAIRGPLRHRIRACVDQMCLGELRGGWVDAEGRTLQEVV